MSHKERNYSKSQSKAPKSSKDNKVRKTEKVQVTSHQDAVNNLSKDLSTDSGHQVVYSSLVAIRTKFIKEKNGVANLRELGGVEKLLSLLQTTNHKVLDVATSILGNCSLEEHTRNKILSLDGVALLGAVLKNLSVESIQNRACRTLANLAQDKHCCQVIHNDGLQSDEKTRGKTSQPLPYVSSGGEEDQPTLLEAVVGLLEKATSAECQQTAIRALRLLGDTEEHRRNILECQGLKIVCKSLKSEDKDVVLGALKTASHYMQGSLSDAVVWQFVNAEGPRSLLALASHKVTAITDYASSMLQTFVKQPALRPCLGNAGAVTHFISKIDAENNMSMKEQLPYINGLCLFCHEVVNRVRIRDGGGLQLLLKYLDNRQYSAIHYRIISALVCYLHDDPSMELLLQNKLILILIRHLKNCAGLKTLNLMETLMSVSEMELHCERDTLHSTRENDQKLEKESTANINQSEALDDTLVYSDNYEVTKEAETSSLTDVSSSNKEAREDINTKNFHRSVSAPVLNKEMSVSKQGSLIEKRSLTEQGSLNITSLIQGSTENHELPDINEKEFHRSVSVPMNAVSLAEQGSPTAQGSLERELAPSFSGGNISRNKEGIKYSMDSPTYREICEHSFEDPHSTSGPRNIFEARSSMSGRFSPYSSPSQSTSIYSPLSTSSYASPSWSLKSSPERCTSPTESLFNYTQPSSPSVQGDSHTNCYDWSDNFTMGTEGSSNPSSDQMGASRSFSPLAFQSLPSSPHGSDMWWNSGGGEMKETLVYSDEEYDETSKDGKNCLSATEKSLLKAIANDNDSSNRKLCGSPLFLSQNSNSTFSVPLRSDPIYAETMTVTDFGKALKGENLARAISVESTVDAQVPDSRKGEMERGGTSSNYNVEGGNRRKAKKRKLSASSSVSSLKRRTTVSIFEDLLEKTIGSPVVSDNTDEANKPVDRHTEAKKTTENNILVILSKLSYMDDQCTHLMSSLVFDTLILYAMLADDPISRVDRILRRLSQNPKCLEALILFMIPLKLDLCYSVCKKYFKQTRESLLESGDKSIENVPNIINLNSACMELFRTLINSISMTVASKYGEGVLEHLLLAGREEEKLLCSLNLPVVCRLGQSLRQYPDGLEHVLNGLEQHQQDDSDLAVSLELLVYYLHKVAHLGDVVLLYKGLGMNPKVSCLQPLLHQLHNAGENSYKRQASWMMPKGDPKENAGLSLNRSIGSKGEERTSDVFLDNKGGELPVGEIGNFKTIENRVTFLLDDGTSVTCDRNTLATISSVFAAMLEGTFSERHQSEIALPHIQSQPFRILANLLHGDIRTLRSYCNPEGLDMLLEILKLCDRFLLVDYLQDLSNVVFSILNGGNLVRVMSFSMHHNCSELARRCLSYLLLSDVPLSQRLLWIKRMCQHSGVNEVTDLLRNVFTNHMSAKMKVLKAT